MLLLDSDSTFLRGRQVNKGFSAYRGNRAGGTARIRPPLIWWQIEPSRTSTAWRCLTKKETSDVASQQGSGFREVNRVVGCREWEVLILRNKNRQKKESTAQHQLLPSQHQYQADSRSVTFHVHWQLPIFLFSRSAQEHTECRALFWVAGWENTHESWGPASWAFLTTHVCGGGTPPPNHPRWTAP